MKRELLRIRRNLLAEKKVLSEILKREVFYVNIGDFFLPVKLHGEKIITHVGAGVFLELGGKEAVNTIDKKIEVIERRLKIAGRVKKSNK